MQKMWVAGRYSSPLSSAGKRFAATLGELTGGRVGLTAGSLGVLKVRLLSQASWACTFDGEPYIFEA